MREKKVGVPREHTLIFLKLARIGQAIANQTEIEELGDVAKGEIKRFVRCNLLNKNELFEYFLQGFIPETQKKFENPPPLRKIKEGFNDEKSIWTKEWQDRYIEVGELYFEKYYKENIESILK